MSIDNSNKINQLLKLGTRNGLFFSKWLKEKGYSDQLIKKYRNSGWLTSLANGVMFRTGESLSAYAALQCYNQQLGKEFRIAAHSALELVGFNHYVPMGKPLLMVAYSSKQNTPVWMQSEVFDKTIKTFSTDTFSVPQVTIIQKDELELLISTPEQAFLECLLLAPQQYNYMDLYYIMEQLTTLRSEVIQNLLETTKNLRVKRMLLYMAEKAGHFWFDVLDTSSFNLGTSKLQLVKGGVFIAKYKITVPKELYEYD
ncbi:MAG TPA: type IV toxin-antitoxin system AbiEi family antitoxin domain-containing protein [Thermoclostridium sp.]|nr:type IV toxin-antitoxin system AbiEi family antitoxin domain-containing protein [Thermoclostridium sp.]